MVFESRLVTRRPTTRPGVYTEDPVLFERDFGHWLTLDQREIPDGPKDTVVDRVSAYDGALLDEFLATLNARIAFWVNVGDAYRRKEAAMGRYWPTVGMGEIAAYVERLEWVSRQASDPLFVRRDGSAKFSTVAIALKYGIESALQYLGGSSINWSDDDVEDAHLAAKDLEFLIYQQRGTAVQFTPPSSLNST